MEIVLTQDVPKLGTAGQTVSVKDGYARNYLIPAGLAMRADRGSLRRLEEMRRSAEAKALREMKSHQAVAQRMAKLELVAKVQVGEENRMFGAVTSADIAEMLASHGIEIDRRIIDLSEPIKSIGVHNVAVKLHADVVARVKVRVEPVQPSE